MYSVILCGGSGTRLWPLSHPHFPKQFLKLYSDKSLLQETYLRVRKLMPREHVIMVTNQAGYAHVAHQISELDRDFDPAQILIEPASLNTAPAIAYAATYLSTQRKVPREEAILILPADHYIGNTEAYISLLKTALVTLGKHIATIGIQATTPETGYGYIEKGESLGSAFRVEQFCEKPAKATAQEYVASGKYLWNSGMYLMSLETIIREFTEHAPEIAALMSTDWQVFLEKFSSLPSISFDYAVSEKSQSVVVFVGDFGWSDIGSFDSLAAIADNRFPAQHLALDSENIFIHSENNRIIATIGVEDIIIIESDRGLLICKRGRSDEVKKIFEKLPLVSETPSRSRQSSEK